MKLLFALVVLIPLAIAAKNIRPGGGHDIDVDLQNDNVVFAMKGVNMLFKSQGDNNARTAVTILSATAQTVTGQRYKFTLQVTGGPTDEVCEVEVWERLWLTGAETRQILGSPSCKEMSQPGSMAGAPVQASLTDADVQKAYKVAERRVNSMLNTMSFVRGTQANDVTKQLVNGVIYRFNGLKFYKTSCLKSEAANDASACTVDPANTVPMSVCDIQVYFDFIANTYTVSKSSCKNPGSMGLLGGPTVVSLSESDVQSAYKYVEQRVNKMINTPNFLRAVSAGKVTKQVVAGMIYKFEDLQFYKTSCLKTEDTTNKQCTADTIGQSTSTCSAVVEVSIQMQYTLREIQCISAPTA